MTFLKRPQMNPIDFAYFKPHTHTHSCTCIHICYANSGEERERVVCVERASLCSCSLSQTNATLIHEWRRLLLFRISQLVPTSMHFQRERESARESGGWKLVKTRASLAAALHHSFISSSAQLLSESLVQENKKAQGGSNNNK